MSFTYRYHGQLVPNNLLSFEKVATGHFYLFKIIKYALYALVKIMCRSGYSLPYFIVLRKKRKFKTHRLAEITR